MDLLLASDAPAHRGYQRVSQYLWEHYGQHYFRKPRPQALPFAEYARAFYPASFDYKGYTVEIEDNLPVMVTDPRMGHSHGPLAGVGKGRAGNGHVAADSAPVVSSDLHHSLVEQCRRCAGVILLGRGIV